MQRYSGLYVFELDVVRQLVGDLVTVCCLVGSCESMGSRGTP